MKNYFNEDQQVFIKLYKKTGTEVLYWELWNTNTKTEVAHSGELDDTGKKENILERTAKQFREKCNNLIRQKINEGYEEIPLHKHFCGYNQF